MVVVGLLLGTLFWQLDQSDFNAIFAVMFFAILNLAVSGMATIPGIIEERRVIYRQTAAKFFHPLSYSIAHTVVDIPMSVLEVVLFCSIVYWMVGLSPVFFDFVMFMLTIFLTKQAMNSFFKVRLPSSCPPGAEGGGLGWLGWIKASPGRQPMVRAAFPAGPDWVAVPGCPVTRPTGLLTAPRPCGGARGREMPPCLCVCALVCLRGGGGLWHTCLFHFCSALAHMARGSVCLVLQAPAGRLESLTLSPPGEMWAWAHNLHVTRTSYPTAPRLPIGTGRRWYLARLGSDPHSLTAFGTGGAATWAGSGSPRPRA